MIVTTAGALRFTDFSVWYGARQALHTVTIAIEPGIALALIGPSGCGKSTLLRACNRMTELVPGTRHTGTVHLDDGEIHAREVDVRALRQRVGMVFQQSNPLPRSIFENVAYGPRLNGVPDGSELTDRVTEALRRAAIWDEVADRLDDPALALSGGQQQRLCIARALANDPEVLLLDEPASALDPGATQRIEELLYDLRGSVTIVIVTHNLQQAARVSDRTAFLYDGRLVEVGETSALFTRPREAQTEAFITGRFG
ncbi:MAG: phosphate ABC transporter ATP-binding protein PstB [Gemmatimonadaceae bacterium]|jgi:phosphate transport system ATP-binding protein|nr:phosphate ABC transporter ATP-binding protein PstB [Gemmatimonadaceae bacterium]